MVLLRVNSTGVLKVGMPLTQWAVIGLGGTRRHAHSRRVHPVGWRVAAVGQIYGWARANQTCSKINITCVVRRLEVAALLHAEQTITWPMRNSLRRALHIQVFFTLVFSQLSPLFWWIWLHTMQASYASSLFSRLNPPRQPQAQNETMNSDPEQCDKNNTCMRTPSTNQSTCNIYDNYWLHVPRNMKNKQT